MDEVNFLTTNLEQDNVVDDIQLILLNIPQDASLLEKIRWLYIKM